MNNIHTKTIQDMPLDIIALFFTHLDYQSAQNLRRVCNIFDSIYRYYRNQMPGPVCHAKIQSQRGQLTLRIQDKNQKNFPKIVDLSSWSYFFKNAQAIHLSITTDDSFSRNLISQVLCCQSIERIDYNGSVISDECLRSLSALWSKTCLIRVRRWTENLGGSSKREQFWLTDPIENLDKISNLMKSSGSLTWSMNYENFPPCLSWLETIQQRTLAIDSWLITINNVPEELDITSVCEQFVEKIRRCSTNQITHDIEQIWTSYEIRILKK